MTNFGGFTARDNLGLIIQIRKRACQILLSAEVRLFSTFTKHEDGRLRNVLFLSDCQPLASRVETFCAIFPSFAMDNFYQQIGINTAEGIHSRFSHLNLLWEITIKGLQKSTNTTKRRKLAYPLSHDITELQKMYLY